MRRFSAGMRAIVAMLCTILLLSNEPRPGGPAIVVLLVYDLLAGLILWGEASGRPLAWPLLQYWIDVTWTGLMLLLTDASTHMLIFTAVQPVVLASIGYGVGHGVPLALYAAFWVLIQVDPRNELGLGLDLAQVAPAAAVLALVPVAALLARPMSVLRRRLDLMREIDARLDPRRGLGEVTSALVEALRGDLGADLAGVVLPAAAHGAAVLSTADDGTFTASPAVHARLEELLGAMPPGPVTHVARHRLRGSTRLHGSGPGRPGPEVRSALGELCNLLEMRTLLVLPLRRYQQRHGYLLVGRRGARASGDEVDALANAAPEFFRILEQAALVDSLVRETAAHERVRIGRDLHDSAIQPYVGLKFALEALLRRVAPDNPARGDIEAMVRLVDGEIAALREVVSGLRNGEPAGDNALLPAVRRQVRYFGELFNIEIRLDCPEQLRTSRALAGAVFHMVNEALNNVRKHTPARSVDVSLTHQDGLLRLSVRDDGASVRGRPARDFLPASLAERAAELGGKLAVTRPDGLNTEIVVTIPADAVVEH